MPVHLGVVGTNKRTHKIDQNAPELGIVCSSQSTKSWCDENSVRGVLRRARFFCAGSPKGLLVAPQDCVAGEWTYGL